MGFLGRKDLPVTVIDAGTSGSIWRGKAIVGTSPVLLLSASEGRIHASIFNHTNASIYIGADHGTVQTGSFDVKLASGSYFELPRPIWRGAVYGVSDAANSQVFMLDISGSIS